MNVIITSKQQRSFCNNTKLPIIPSCSKLPPGLQWWARLKKYLVWYNRKLPIIPNSSMLPPVVGTIKKYLLWNNRKLPIIPSCSKLPPVLGTLKKKLFLLPRKKQQHTLFHF